MKLHKLYIFVMIVACFILAVGAAECASSEEESSAIRYEGPGYDTPEAAVSAYIEAAKHLDADGMVRAFAIESAADGCDTLGVLSQQMYWDINMQANLIADHAFIDRYRALSRLRTVTNTIMWEFILLNNPDCDQRSNFVVNVRREGEAAIDAAKETIDVSALADLLPAIDRVRFYTPEELDLLRTTPAYSNSAQKWMETNALLYGADEYCSVFGEFTILEQEYYFSALTGCYEGRWYILTGNSMDGIIMGKTAAGGILFFPKSPDEL